MAHNGEKTQKKLKSAENVGKWVKIFPDGLQTPTEKSSHGLTFWERKKSW